MAKFEAGACRLSVVPVRAEGSDKAEIVTQLLFGDQYRVLESSSDEKWLKIRIDFDQYEGWIDTKQHFEEAERPQSDSLYIFTELMYMMVFPFGPVNIQMGSILDGSDEVIKEQMDELFEEGAVKPLNEKRGAAYLEERALQYMNAPYLWGGKSLFGIDCSGFVQQLFKMCGIALPRDAWQQAEIGQTVEDLATVRNGDVAFFHNEKGRITHVGILLSDEEIIHASGRVRIDRFDEQGIFNEETQQHSHKLTKVQRFF